MKKGIIVFFILLSLIQFSIAAAPGDNTPDDDRDGAPNCGRDNVCGNADDDKCPNSLTHFVDAFGCSCAQKNCPADNDPNTEDCKVVNQLAACCNDNGGIGFLMFAMWNLT